MNKISIMKFNIFNKLVLTGFILSFAFSINAQDWSVPSDKSKITSPTPFNSKMKMDGKDIYNKNCKSCHGDIGKNNFIALTPEPGDPASKKFSTSTDGDLFYKITTGKGAMPKFKDQLDDTERWSVIAYIRSFHTDYTPTEGANTTEEVTTFNGKDLKLFVNMDQVNLEITTEVQGNIDGNMVPANGVRVGFFIKRNFGLLPVCETVTTNEKGIAKAKFPSDLPGDSLGNYNIIIKLIDDDLYGKVEYNETIDWGKSFIYDNPLNHRAMWGNRGNVPLWLMFSYFGMLLAAFITIGWVMLQLKKLKNSGK